MKNSIIRAGEKMRGLQASLAWSVGLLASTLLANATPIERSPRPDPRPIIAATAAGQTPSSRLEISYSQRPIMRTPRTSVVTTPESVIDVRVSDAGFRQWITAFERRARTAGISQSTLTQAFRGVQLSDSVIERDRNQSEFNRTLWDYLDSAVSDSRVRNGRAALREHGQALQAIEQRYNVEAEVVAAIWGLESAYGEVRGSNDIIESLATLAYEGRRAQFFEAQLIAALQILQSGDTSPRNMTGSWAGAMGHTQFMPTSYLDYAVDFTGDGRRDIWADDPTDALASTANYLARFGWTYGQPWGMEVVLPTGFDFSQSGGRIKRDVSHWTAQGVRLPGGGRIPDHGQSSILLPAGSEGVALVIFDNFQVIERYNPADAYVIGVGHLSDRIAGGDAFRSGWPRGDRALSRNEREELQQRLTRTGFPTDGVDGIIGPNTIQAVRQYQQSQGLVPDGYASLRLLQQLR
ncbi:MAG: membrane-bound lytic murein transglycosylase B [Paracoccaceae bacterium]|jgi:membrane-bound lytic murein transglycosylase B